MSRKSIAPGIYVDSRNGSFLERPIINGKTTWRKIPAQTLKDAKDMLSARRTDQARAVHGLARDPYAPPAKTVADLCIEYEKKGCPDRQHSSRKGKQLYDEQSRIKQLIAFFGKRQADTIRSKDCGLYFSWRKARVKRGTGARTTDLELVTLANVFNWAVSLGKMDANPIAVRQRFRPGKTIKHCYQFMPSDAEELHALATYFFKRRQSEVLGWQVLLQAMTGCRTSEIVRLRWDAKDRTEAGFVENDWLWLNRSKNGVRPWSHIHDSLKECLEALKRWRLWRNKTGPWWLPSSHSGKEIPLNASSLTKSLARASRSVCGKHRTSHGLRAYYVTVRRSQGIGDGQIADELGDSSGASTVVASYGGIPDNWRGGEGLTWMPKGEPAWAMLKMPGNILSLDVHVPVHEKK